MAHVGRPCGATDVHSEEKVLTSVLAERERDLRVATAKLSETERAVRPRRRSVAQGPPRDTGLLIRVVFRMLGGRGLW